MTFNADPNAQFDQLVAALKERAFRLTPQRLELVRMIVNSDGHSSASQLYAKIRSIFPTTSQATIYKTLSMFKVWIKFWRSTCMAIAIMTASNRNRIRPWSA